MTIVWVFWDASDNRGKVRMAILRSERHATGGPGIEPRWTRGANEAVGAAYSASSHVWFTITAGVLTEVYYPTVDTPQTRDLQFLVSDGETFSHDERRHCESHVTYLSESALGVRVVSTNRDGHYRLTKEIIADPHADCVLLHVHFEPRGPRAEKMRLYALLAPHLESGGHDNIGNVAEAAGREILTAHKHNTWLAMGASAPFLRRSCGYVGTSDGWTDLTENYQLDWEYDVAESGNIALVGELDLSGGRTFTLGLAFGDSLQRAVSTLFQSLGVSFRSHRKRFIEQWTRACRKALPLTMEESLSRQEPLRTKSAAARTKGKNPDARGVALQREAPPVQHENRSLYGTSHSLLLAHEDKLYPGALIASLSIPWGHVKGDVEDLGGYHLVWTRDMVNSATGLLASGNMSTPLRALIYLAATQRADGGFYQNFWIDGEPYWHGVQLDEVAFPILLAWRLHELDALQAFDPYAMVLHAASYLVREGPWTPQERWEENSGYSPSTLACTIAALICAACFVEDRGDARAAQFLREYADFLEGHVEAWTVTTQGTLVPGISRHYIRILPVNPAESAVTEDPNTSMLTIRNRPPGTRADFPAKEIVDAGFLELVRYGVRRAGDPLMEDSLRVIDAVLKVDTPHGPCWHRYNNDGYGERDDGGPYEGFGKGRAWPLLTGERGHYELAAGRDPWPYLHAMENFASETGLLPEQIWDEPDRPDLHLHFGCATGSASPLMWAHAEYIKLLRSFRDGRVFDRIPAVHERYAARRRKRRAEIEVWKFNRRVQSVQYSATLRILAPDPFRLRWTCDEWRHSTDTPSSETSLGVHFADLSASGDQSAPLRFTFYWPDTEHWEGQDFEVRVAER
jgi:glucoamylase